MAEFREPEPCAACYFGARKVRGQTLCIDHYLMWLLTHARRDWLARRRHIRRLRRGKLRRHIL